MASQIISVLLILQCAERASAEFAQHAIIVGIDGLKVSSLLRMLENNQVPNLKDMREGGSYTDECRSVQPTLSLPNWSAHLLGASPSFTGIYWNEWTYSNNTVPNPDGVCKKWPDLFTVAKQLDTSVKTSMFYTWDAFDVILPDTAVDFERHYYPDGVMDCRSNTEYDGLMTDDIVKHITAQSQQDSQNRSITFIYFGSPDECAHEHGTNSAEFNATMVQADNIIGQILEAIGSSKTIVFVVSDHGRKVGFGYDHGGFSYPELRTQWIAFDKQKLILSGHKIYSSVSPTDTAYTVVRSLGLRPPTQWHGRAVEEVFAKKDSVEDIYPEQDYKLEMDCDEACLTENELFLVSEHAHCGDVDLQLPMELTVQGDVDNCNTKRTNTIIVVLAGSLGICVFVLGIIVCRTTSFLKNHSCLTGWAKLPEESDSRSSTVEPIVEFSPSTS